eukprot:1249926-Rhodomonas_salina.1
MLRSIRLRACYAISGTDIAYGAVRLRACYAIPGTNLAYGAIRLLAYAFGLRACYAMSSTDLAYGATPRPSTGTGKRASFSPAVSQLPAQSTALNRNSRLCTRVCVCVCTLRHSVLSAQYRDTAPYALAMRCAVLT